MPRSSSTGFRSRKDSLRIFLGHDRVDGFLYPSSKAQIPKLSRYVSEIQMKNQVSKVCYRAYGKRSEESIRKA